MLYNIVVNEYGTTSYFRPNTFQEHRLDGPARIYADGTRMWMQNSKLHRTDGPAIEHTSGYTAWFVNGQKQTR